MTHTVCEMMWRKSLLWELEFSEDGLMHMQSDNQVATYITSNQVFHERIKHIEMDCHFVRNAVCRKLDFYFVHSVF